MSQEKKILLQICKKKGNLFCVDHEILVFAFFLRGEKSQSLCDPRTFMKISEILRAIYLKNEKKISATRPLVRFLNSRLRGDAVTR